MNKLLSRISKGLLGLSLACGVGTVLAFNSKNAQKVDAGQAVYKTAMFGSSYNSKATNKYDQSWSATYDGFTVDLVNFSNNNNGWNYVKCGRNGTASVGTITTHSAIDKAITKVAITIDALTASKINSITLSSSSNGSSYSNIGTFTKSTGVKEVTISSPTQSQYYKLTFDCASGSSNGLITISKVEYYYESDVTATSLNVGAISTYPGHTAEVSVTANPNGASMPTSLSYSSSDTSVFTVANGVVTGVGAGSATLRVDNASNSSVYGTATVTVNAYPSISNRITVNGSNKYAIYATYSSLNYSLNGVSGGSSGYGTVSSGESGDVNIDLKIDIVSGIYANTVAFRTDTHKYIGYSSNLTATGNNYLHFVDSLDEHSNWIVTNDQVILAQTYGTATERHMLFNYNSGTNSRFACYIPSSQNSSYPTPQFHEIISQSLTGISVDDASLYPGHEKQLSVLPVPAEASLEDATYTFSSASPSIAEVNENGVVLAHAAGSAVITITANVGGSNYSTTATITVNSYPSVSSGLTLNTSYIISGELEGTEYELTGIESEHHYGLVTAVSGSYSMSFAIKPVGGYYANTIAFETVDDSAYLKSTKSGSNLSLDTHLNVHTSWVVSYSNGVYSVISAETYGEATQRHLLLNKNTSDGVAHPRIACYTGVTNTIVNISFFSAEVTATDFTLSESEVSIYKTQTHTLTAEFTPSNTTDRTLSWTSNNTSVATVSNGVVTGVAPGTATITASKVIGGNTVSRTCSVTVLNNVSAHAGTLGDPYSVNDAINVAQGFFTEDSHGNPVVTTGAYVKGIVTNLSYKTTTSISFWIGDNESQTSADNGGFEIYNPGTIMGKTVSERYTAVSQIEEDFAVGVTIIACGDITVYHSTSEFSAGSNVVLNNHIEAVDFAKGFNDAITDGVCESDGSTNQSELASAWLNQADNFDMLDDSTKELFLLIAENGDENGNDIEHAVATYDYILKKYNTEQVTTYIDFMGRVSSHIVTLPATSNYLLGSVITNNTDVIVILIATLTSISCLSAFILIKKRRAN